MKILLDEGVPDVIKKRLDTLSISTVKDMGWRGIRNGALLDLMARECQIIVTTDKNFRFQQNLIKRKICAVILPSNRIRIVVELLPQIEAALAAVTPGDFIELTLKD